MKCFLIFCIIFASNILVFANAGVFGGFGNDIKLVSNSEIQMVSEDIKIKLVPSKEPVTGNLKYLDEAHYDCFFVFRNLSSNPENVKMGFPLSGNDNFMVRGKGDKISRHEFKVWIDGKEIQATHTTNTVDKKFGNIFLWETKFNSKEEKHLRVTYKTFGYTGLGSLRKKPYDWTLRFPKSLEMMDSCLMQSYEYVTLTGKSWNGKIENAKFSINVGEFERYLQKRGYLAEDMNPKKKIDFDLLLRNGFLYRFVSPNGWKSSSNGECLEMECSPYKPDKNISIAYCFTVFPKDAVALKNLFELIENQFTRNKKNFSQEDKMLLSDLILEFYGIKTNNAKLKNFLDTQIWYPVKNAHKLDNDLKLKLLEFSKTKAN